MGWECSKKQYTLYRLFNESFIQYFTQEKFKELDLYLHHPVRYIAMSTAKFLHHNPKTLDIFEYENDVKMRKLIYALTKVRYKYGKDIVIGGGELE